MDAYSRPELPLEPGHDFEEVSLNETFDLRGRCSTTSLGEQFADAHAVRGSIELEALRTFAAGLFCLGQQLDVALSEGALSETGWKRQPKISP